MNQALLNSDKPMLLHDKRDELVHEIALNFNVSVSYGTNGIANIQSKSSGQLIVGSDFYTQISYGGASGINAVIEDSFGAAHIRQFGKDNKETYSNTFIGGSGDPTILIRGGKMGALVDLRDNILPNNGDKIKALGRNFADQLNAVHNNGSPYPPITRFESSISVNANETMDWGDPFTVYFVDANGEQLRGGAGRLNSATIDMNNIAFNSPSGKATMGDLIKELNEKLDLAPSRQRAAIGAIFDGSNIPVQMAGEYLVNNIQLRARSTVDAFNNNSFTFDLDLQGNSHFSSNIEILDVRTHDVGGANPQVVANNLLPANFTLEKDKNTTTGQNITVRDAEDGRIITLRVRVTGDNGEVSEGNVSFAANSAVTLNDRIAFDNVVANATTGGFANPAASHSGLARAKIVDDSGNEIDPSSGTRGKLVITSNTDQYRIVIQGGDFNSRFGFNDLFKFNDKTGQLTLNPDIANDVGRLSLGRAHQDAGIATAHTVGDVKAQATLAFAGAFAANDTITINAPNMPAPVVLTFVAALNPVANPNEVLLAGGLNNPDGLIDRINAHPFLKGIVEATNNGGNVAITAKAAGTKGNTITVASNLAVATVNINNAGALGVHGATALNAGAGISGTDKVISVPVFNYTIKPGDQQVINDIKALQTQAFPVDTMGVLPYTVTTLSSLATIVTGLLSNTINSAQSKSNIALEVLKQTKASINEVSGINKDTEYLKILNKTEHLRVLSYVAALVRKSTEQILDTFRSIF